MMTTERPSRAIRKALHKAWIPYRFTGRPGSGPEGDVVVAPSRNGGEDIRQALLDDLVDAVIGPVSGPWSPVMASASDGETFEIIPIR